MRRVLSAQKDLKIPGAEKSPYAPKKIFHLSKIARDGPNKLKDKPLPTARLLIKRGIAAIEVGLGRASEI